MAAAVNEMSLDSVAFLKPDRARGRPTNPPLAPTFRSRCQAIGYSSCFACAASASVRSDSVRACSVPSRAFSAFHAW
jgi:hypothetical protein